MPTPTAQNFEQREETWRARRERQRERNVNGNGFGLTLGMAAQELDTMLATPRATRGGSSTENAEALLPTVTAQAAKHGTDDRGPGTLDDRNLWTIVPRLLPTPLSNDWKGPNRSGSGASSANALATAVDKLLPTPQAHDAQGPKTPEQIAAMRARGYGVSNLNEEVLLLPTPTTSDGNGPGTHGEGSPDLRTVLGDPMALPSPDGSASSDGQLPLPLTPSGA